MITYIILILLCFCGMFFYVYRRFDEMNNMFLSVHKNLSCIEQENVQLRKDFNNFLNSKISSESIIDHQINMLNGRAAVLESILVQQKEANAQPKQPNKPLKPKKVPLKPNKIKLKGGDK